MDAHQIVSPPMDGRSDPSVIPVPLTHGHVALIDAADAPLVLPHRWYAYAHRRGGFYARRVVGKKAIYLHRLVLAARPNEIVDHVSGETLDCRRQNLRLATPAQNAANRRPHRNTATGLKGVWLRRGSRSKPYAAQLQVNGRRIHLGDFATPEEGAAAYDAAARVYHGAFARTNHQES